MNSKDNCYNAEILHKKLARIDVHIAKYLKQREKQRLREQGGLPAVPKPVHKLREP